jgi:hypothetical protein
MVEVIIREKNDDSITFRLPSSVKKQLPGAYEEEADGNIKVKFEDGKAIGQLFRDLTKLYTTGRLEQSNSKNRELEILLADQARIIKILKAGTTELLKLMSLSKPAVMYRNKVNMKAIRELQEVI